MTTRLTCWVAPLRFGLNAKSTQIFHVDLHIPTLAGCVSIRAAVLLSFTAAVLTRCLRVRNEEVVIRGPAIEMANFPVLPSCPSLTSLELKYLRSALAAIAALHLRFLLAVSLVSPSLLAALLCPSFCPRSAVAYTAHLFNIARPLFGFPIAAFRRASGLLSSWQGIMRLERWGWCTMLRPSSRPGMTLHRGTTTERVNHDFYSHIEMMATSGLIWAYGRLHSFGSHTNPPSNFPKSSHPEFWLFSNGCPP